MNYPKALPMFPKWYILTGAIDRQREADGELAEIDWVGSAC